MTRENKFLKNTIENLKNSGKNVYERRLSTVDKRKTTAGKVGDFLGLMLKYFLLYGLAFIIMYPILQQISIALRDPADINNPLVLWIPEKLSLTNFKVALIVLDYWKALKNTFVISFGVTVIQVFITALAGYAFARLNFKGKNLLFGLVIAIIIIAPTTIEIPLKDTLKNFLGLGINISGSPKALYTLSGLGLGIRSGIFIYLFRQFFRGIPEELEDAAYMDGANPIQVFLKIMLPNARGGILLTAILTFVWQWNDNYYTTNFVAINANIQTLTTQIMGIKGNIQGAIMQAGVYALFDQDVTKNPLFTSMILNTCAILSMIPLIIFYLFVQKPLFTEGVERSGLVG